jgi:protein SCO1/2
MRYLESQRIKNDKVVQGDRLDSVNPVAVSEGQLLKKALLPNLNSSIKTVKNHQ